MPSRVAARSSVAAEESKPSDDKQDLQANLRHEAEVAELWPAGQGDVISSSDARRPEPMGPARAQAEAQTILRAEVSPARGMYDKPPVRRVQVLVAWKFAKQEHVETEV